MDERAMRQSTSAARQPEDDPVEAQGFCARAGARQQSGDLPGALADLDQAARLSTSTAEASVYRGMACYLTGHNDEAVRELTTAIDLDPAAKGAHTWRGAARLMLGQVSQSIEDYSEAIRLNPEMPNGYVQRGVAYDHANDHAAAIADYSTALRLNANDFKARLYRAQAHSAREDYEAALCDLSAAIRLKPHDFRAYLRRAQAYYALEDYESALPDLDEAIRLNAQCAEAYFCRGRLRKRDDQTEGALADYDQAIRLDPSSADAWCERGELRAEMDQPEKALADLTEAIRLNPVCESAYEARSAVWADIGQDAKSSEDLEMAIRVDSVVIGGGAALSEQVAESGQTATRPSFIYDLLKAHFSPAPLDSLTITERRFPGRVRADLQRAIDSLFEQMTVLHFTGVRKQYAHSGVNFNQLVVRDRSDPALAVPPQYEQIDIGEAEPVRCLKEGLWLLEAQDRRFAVFLEPFEFMHRAFGNEGIRFQVATPNDEVGSKITQQFFRHLERSVEEARSYRGKILSLEQEAHGFSGTSTGIKVHKLRTVERDQVILSRQTLELLDRNVIQFVRQRPRLSKLGLSTKKGLLFYGPPGVGKTHTLHYLAGALPGTTTLLISAEQVGLLGEYMTLARLLQPSLVVIEDADLIARERTKMESVCEEVLLNKLLNEMDGLKEDADVLFILTTNRPETLEAALTSRPGRIDQAIEFPLPDEEGRAKLVRLYSRGLAVPEVVIQETVKKTENVSGAFIKELMRRAAQFLIERNGADEMNRDDVNQALEELLFSGGSLNRKLLGGPSASPDVE
ncbi:MAG TPA: tetratricopeptide repeat protein [Planctomycetaceae bacterium]|jgi:tetratricopeptide (TPR) repeat protein/energy-coupling factor transporter ATP-binding protein EcfA2|nr:tetratricopeptide repeat protein [Planctomycetaceae bacterium]